MLPLNREIDFDFDSFVRAGGRSCAVARRVFAYRWGPEYKVFLRLLLLLLRGLLQLFFRRQLMGCLS